MCTRRRGDPDRISREKPRRSSRTIDRFDRSPALFLATRNCLSFYVISVAGLPCVLDLSCPSGKLLRFVSPLRMLQQILRSQLSTGQPASLPSLEVFVRWVSRPARSRLPSPCLALEWSTGAGSGSLTGQRTRYWDLKLPHKVRTGNTGRCTGRRCLPRTLSRPVDNVTRGPPVVAVSRNLLSCARNAGSAQLD